jgi:prevent-host-death family protein
MTTVNVEEAKTHLSRLVAQAAAGEEVIIAEAGKPIAKLVSIVPSKPQRRIGGLEGKMTVPEDFKTGFAKEIAEMFYGADSP